MTKIFRIIPHTLIVLALIFIVIEVLDWYNPYMNFLGLSISTILLIAFCLLSFAVPKSPMRLFPISPQSTSAVWAGHSFLDKRCLGARRSFALF